MAGKIDMNRKAEEVYGVIRNYARICSRVGEGVSVFDDAQFKQLCVNYLNMELELISAGGEIAGRRATTELFADGLAQRL